MLQISENLLELLQTFEGFRETPYVCAGGYRTIGYGHVLRASDPLQKITKTAALDLLREDARIAAIAVNRLIHVPLTQNQLDALTSFTFNLGSGALQRSTLRRLINRQNHEAVPRELNKWVWAGGKRLPGLIKRRKVEGFLYQTI